MPALFIIANVSEFCGVWCKVFGRPGVTEYAFTHFWIKPIASLTVLIVEGGVIDHPSIYLALFPWKTKFDCPLKGQAENVKNKSRCILNIT